MRPRVECGPHPPGVVPIPDDGRRHLGRMETVLHRQWAAGTRPHPTVIGHIDALANLPFHIADRVIDEVEGIYVGEGSVVDLDGLGHLRGRPTDPDDPASRTFDRFTGIYRYGVVAIGGRPHQSVSLVLHEVGHVLDVADRMMSETREWRDLHRACLPLLKAAYWHKRDEWWAEAFALTAAHKEHLLVSHLAGDVSLAYAVMEYFEYNYGVTQ
ncbi:hypothetical protein LG943_03680 [Streptomonospora sp. S1-112]|uniref:Anthrax toxin lethal/endema factor N-/C-terminal domain-containing protein n=2 Tax=Streptomonospora TaxID=104204 RepID=A0A853BH60_9ACTN|nr:MULTISPECIES: hypothetical protein [Streptomonospora]MBV2363137.1 hypothetical protein [Streptomonospora nanhaiensis]MBX9389235.1 hypothetical protein [Streptomonospora nanhaiensis]MDA0563433.1 hypothetical protein [Streptomonospora mangrovi]NYI94370.1 hypothetical protein [Streptomonospora nanhaiensis]